ncbi:MAG: hypothetical protein AB8B71_08885 [Paracoccaceae bacterium]
MWTEFKNGIAIAAMVCALATAQTSKAVAEDTPAFDPLKRTVSPLRFRLRGTFHDASVIAPASDELKDRIANPFVLSYLKDNVASDEVFALRGALFGSFRIDNPAGVSPSIASYAFGVVVNQAKANGETTQDTIGFKLGGAWLIGNYKPKALIRSLYMSADVGWLTDSGFDLSVFTANARYEVFGETRGFAGAPYRTGNFAFELRPVAELQFQHVADADGRAEFLGEDNRLYAGIRLLAKAGFVEGPLERMSFDAEYQAFEDVIGTAPSTELVTVGINWALDDDSNAVLRLSYENGETPTQSESDKISMGLGLSF